MTPEWAGAPFRLAIGALFVLALYGLRRGTRSLTVEGGHPLLASALDPRTLAILAGVGSSCAVAWSGSRGFENLASLTIVLAVGWCGIAIGCGLDLRALQRSSPLIFLIEAGQVCAAICLAGLVLLSASSLPDVHVPALLPVGYFMLAAICVADLPARRPLSTPRGRVGSRHGFWEPSVVGLAAVLLVAIGSSLSYPDAAVSQLLWNPQLDVVIPPALADSIRANRILCGLAVGAIIGFLCDLASREETLPEGLFFIISALALLGGGIASTLQLTPLWIGLMAGAWLINSTLRRLDVVHVIERGRSFLRYGLPVLAGWVVGWGSFSGFAYKTFATVFIVIILIRPAVKMAGLQVNLRLRERHGKSLSLMEVLEACEVDETGVAIALSFAFLLPADVGAAAVAAVMAAQLLLRLANTWAEGYANRDGK